MPRPLSRPTRNQITFFLKGDLKNLQTAYLRIGGKLAQIRDEKLYAALKHTSLEEYAERTRPCGAPRSTATSRSTIGPRKKHRDWFASIRRVSSRA